MDAAANLLAAEVTLMKSFDWAKDEDPEPVFGRRLSSLQRNQNASLHDPCTGLPNLLHIEPWLQREIARSRLFGARSALVLLDVVEASPGRALAGLSTQAARVVGQALEASAGEADFVARLDETRFLVFLAECDAAEAAAFADEVRTGLGSQPYAHSTDGGRYVRSWVGCVAWGPEVQDAEAYVLAAVKVLESTRGEYEAQRDWFAGAANP
jgi:GGDEF domain-containing protein